MAQASVDKLEAALARHASESGEVFPSALTLIAAEEHWTGRLWDVTHLVMADQEAMRYAAGGNRPGEIAACAARWSDAELDLDDIKLILGCGGYDPDPFVSLAKNGLIRSALQLTDGTPRLIHGEKAGAWISDTLALASSDEIVETVQREIRAAEAAKH